MSESTKPWASNSTFEPSIMAPLRIMPRDRDRFDLERDESRHWAAVTTDYNEALITDASVLPSVLTGSKLDTKIKSLPDFFIGGGFIVLSQRCADVFKAFDLGYGGLSPVTIYQGDRKSFISDQHFYLLYFGCQKQAFLPEHSSPAAFMRKTPVRGGHMRYSGAPLEDGDCVLRADVLEGPDLWIDLTVGGSFFMSNRLVEALEAGKLTKDMFLKKCKLIA